MTGESIHQKVRERDREKVIFFQSKWLYIIPLKFMILKGQSINWRVFLFFPLHGARAKTGLALSILCPIPSSIRPIPNSIDQTEDDYDYAWTDE